MYIFDTEAGRLISQDHQRIAEIINDYDHTLFLVWIPPEDRDTEDSKDFPFAVSCMPENAAPYILFRLRETEVDHRVIARIFEMDNVKNTAPAVARIENEIKAKEAVKLREQFDEMMERHELSASILASPLNTYKHNGVKYQ